MPSYGHLKKGRNMQCLLFCELPIFCIFTCLVLSNAQFLAAYFWVIILKGSCSCILRELIALYNMLKKCCEIRTHKFMPQHKNQPCKFCRHKIGKTLLSVCANYCKCSCLCYNFWYVTSKREQGLRYFLIY